MTKRAFYTTNDLVRYDEGPCWIRQRTLFDTTKDLVGNNKRDNEPFLANAHPRSRFESKNGRKGSRISLRVLHFDTQIVLALVY